MGGGSWTTESFRKYSLDLHKAIRSDNTIDYSGTSAQNVFVQRTMSYQLDPKGVTRECRDSEEHPGTLPVILALDVTGSMGEAAKEVASKLNQIMSTIFDSRKDVEFLIMGIGDLYCDHCPIQASQFESDIRIAEQLDLLYFEGGGGGNDWESYTSAWWFGLHHTDLDCWKRGAKGVIITIGDEEINPCLQCSKLNLALSDHEQEDVRTDLLYGQASEKFDIHHIHVSHDFGSKRREASAVESFSEVIGAEHVHVSNVDGLGSIISEVILGSRETMPKVSKNKDGLISW